ncbi:MAG: alpha/beta hydrolase [Candidatus Lokiarchaeota archaeon]|nr:alpha/beta hydrolase [Candidatus Lokiarchaeota archaeon]
MPYFTNDGVKIYYEIEGEGPPIVMIHGFASSLEGNWKLTNWVKNLKDNYKLILLDCRGHGKSDKPHDDSYYGHKMSDDIIKLMEHLSIEKANLFGYSMGAYITFRLLLTKPDIFISAILGGFVLNLIQDDKARSNYIESTKLRIEAFKAASIDQVKDPMARAFRQFAELGGNDLKALAAVTAGLLKERSETMASPAQIKESLKKIKVPIMTVVGSSEILPGDKTLIAQLVPDACHFQIQGKDHLTVVPDSKFKMIVKAFLNHVNRNLG